MSSSQRSEWAAEPVLVVMATGRSIPPSPQASDTSAAQVALEIFADLLADQWL